MSCVVFNNDTLPLEGEETVLDCLLRNGHLIPHGCRAGVCQSCIMAAEGGNVPVAAQRGLTRNQQQLNYFLSCQCRPAEPIQVATINRQKDYVTGTVIEKFWLNEDVICLRVKADLHYEPGQYVTLWKDSTLARSYSIASLPEQDGYLEFHIKCYSNGQFSSWLADSVEPSTELLVQGPLGECFYSADENQPMLLAAISTGLAPVYGIIRHALAKGHSGPINLVVAARECGAHYLVDELTAMAEAHPQFNVHFLSLKDAVSPVVEADIYQFCADTYSNINGWKVYLCGAQSFVAKMRKQCFLKGAKMSDIVADVFLLASTATDSVEAS